jgi:hypothetical protein
MLKEWLARFFSGLEIFFNDLANVLAIIVGQHHGLIKINTTSHVPHEFE